MGIGFSHFLPKTEFFVQDGLELRKPLRGPVAHGLSKSNQSLFSNRLLPLSIDSRALLVRAGWRVSPRGSHTYCCIDDVSGSGVSTPLVAGAERVGKPPSQQVGESGSQFARINVSPQGPVELPVYGGWVGKRVPWEGFQNVGDESERFFAGDWRGERGNGAGR